MTEQSAAEANAWATNNGVLRANLIRATAERDEARADLARMKAVMEKATEVVALMIAERNECESYRGKDNPEPFHRECVKYPDGCQCWDNALAALKGTSP